MRLLERNSNGGFSLTKDLVGNIPAYAILSHTWGDADQEVTFKDFVEGSEKSKAGYQKVQFCGEQAARDGYRYFWVDTCCIDKTSSTELSEAINSMFRWYAESAVCYAYLSDVHYSTSQENEVRDDEIPQDNNEISNDLDEQLAKSKWFTRGWTLQELVAPKQVIFFSFDWTRLGTRHDWLDEISSLTNIHSRALTGELEQIAHCSIAQRMSWTSNRKTTRKEDMAYCLLGIFEVNMPLLYGEGAERAFMRLQEEIIKDSDDQSIFAWDTVPKTLLIGFLAPHPSFFDGKDVVPFKSWKSSEPYSMTNCGLRITGLIGPTPNFNNPDLPPSTHRADHILLLKCCQASAPEKPVGLLLREIVPGGDQFARVCGPLISFQGSDFAAANGFSSRTIFVRKQILLPRMHELKEFGRNIIFKLYLTPRSGGLTIQEVYPEQKPEKLEGQDAFLVHAPNFDLVKVLFSNWTWYIAIWLERREVDQHTFSFILFLGYDAVRGSCWNGALDFPDAGSDSLYEKWSSASIDRNYFSSGVSLSLQCIQNPLDIPSSYNDPADIRVVVGET
jgi:hypothetical protein